MTWPVILKSNTIRVNIDTGEQITKHQSEKLIKLKTNKHVTYNRNKTKGFVEYTIEYTGNGRQQELSFSSE